MAACIVFPMELTPVLFLLSKQQGMCWLPLQAMVVHLVPKTLIVFPLFQPALVQPQRDQVSNDSYCWPGRALHGMSPLDKWPL